MRKIITIIFILLFVGMAVFFIVDRANADDDLTTIRVKLSIGDPITYDFKAVGSYYIAEEPSIQMDGSQYYRVALSGSNNVALYKREDNGSYTLLTTKTSITFIGRDSDNHDLNLLYMHNDRYKTTLAYTGNMMFYKDTGAYHLHAINIIYIEYYLYGVIGYEMSNAWPIEALKAQAVAARSYAATHIGAYTYYDVVDTTGSQVYKGWNDSLNRCITAVNLTKGQVVAYVEEEDKANPNYTLKKGNIVTTYFSASNGGQIDIPQHVWNLGGTPLPWERITNDPYDTANPSSREEIVFFPTYTETESDFATNALKQLKDLAIPILQQSGYSVSSRDDFQLMGVTDMYTLKGQYKTNSSGTLVEDHRKIFSNQTVICLDCWVAFTTITVRVPVTVNGVTTEEDVSMQVRLDLNECEDTSSPYNIFSQTSLRITMSEPVMEGTTLKGYNLIHRRYGHGLGMSQRGAQTMAKEGWTYREILLFYYPNTEIWNLEDANPSASASASTGPVAEEDYNATVVCNTFLNVRTGPGTIYSIIGQATNGERITVITPYADTSWHKILYNGVYAYVHVDYVKLDTPTSPTNTPDTGLPEPSLRPIYSDEPEPSATIPPTSTGTTTPAPTPTATDPDEPDEGALAYDAVGYVTCSSLNVRNGPSTSYSVVGRVYRDDTVYIKKAYATSSWHLIYYGNTVRYVYASYIKITDTTDGYCYYENGVYKKSSSSGSSGDVPDNTDNTMYATVTASSLNIRSGPSTSYTRIGSIPRGGVIKVKEYGTTWSKIEYGGISGYVATQYFNITSGSTSTPAANTATVTASTLNIRSGPGISYTRIGTAPNGATVTIISYDSSWSK
ncbi:MAG: SpoIID/LytB domain-containing protein, partial [Eubacteriales bacterium]